MSFQKCRREVQLQIFVFNQLRNLSSIDTVVRKLKSLHKGNTTLYHGVIKFPYNSPIDMIV